jgi:hypothetical protein
MAKKDIHLWNKESGRGSFLSFAHALNTDRFVYSAVDGELCTVRTRLISDRGKQFWSSICCLPAGAALEVPKQIY